MPGRGHSSLFAVNSTAERYARKRRSDGLDRPDQGHRSGRGPGERVARAVPPNRHGRVERTLDLRDPLRRADPEVPKRRAAQFGGGAQLPGARVHLRVRRGDGDHAGQRDAVRSPEPGGDSPRMVAPAAPGGRVGPAAASRGDARVPAPGAQGGRPGVDAAPDTVAPGPAPRVDVAPRGERADRRGALEDGQRVPSERDRGAPRALPELGRGGDSLARHRGRKEHEGASLKPISVGGRRAASFACAVALAEREAIDVDTAWNDIATAARFDGVDDEGLPVCRCSGLAPEVALALVEVLALPLPPGADSAVDLAANQFKRAAVRGDFAVDQSLVVGVRLMGPEELWEGTETGAADRLAARHLTQLAAERKKTGTGAVTLLRFDPVRGDSEGIARLVHIQRTVRVLQRNGVVVRTWVSPLAVQSLAADPRRLVPILALDAADARILTGTYVVQMACLGHLKFRECMLDVVVDALCDAASPERVVWRALACVATLLARSPGTEAQLPFGVGQLLREPRRDGSVSLRVQAAQPQVLQVLGNAAAPKEKVAELGRLLSCMLDEAETSLATPTHLHTLEMIDTSRPSTPDAPVFPVPSDTRRAVRSSLRELAISALGAFPPLVPGDKPALGLDQFVLLGGAFPVPTDLVPKGSERVFMRAFASPLIGDTYIDTSMCRDTAYVESCRRLSRTVEELRKQVPFVGLGSGGSGNVSLGADTGDTFHRLNTRNGSAVDRPLYELNPKKKRVAGPTPV